MREREAPLRLCLVYLCYSSEETVVVRTSVVYGPNVARPQGKETMNTSDGICGGIFERANLGSPRHLFTIPDNWQPPRYLLGETTMDATRAQQNCNNKEDQMKKFPTCYIEEKILKALDLQEATRT